MRLGGDLNRVVDVVRGRAGSAAARVFEGVPCPTNSAEGTKGAHGRAELGGDGLLDGDVPASAGDSQTLGFEQARCAFRKAS
jgi:hypothetical protein